MDKQETQGRMVASLLSFVAGFVDTVGFVALFGLFTAHVTGNFVLIGASLVRPDAGVIAKLAALPVFVLAVVLATMFVRMRARQHRDALTGVLSAQLVFLAGFAATGVLASPIVRADAPLAVTAGLLGVFAMGLQNAASRLLMADLPPTTVMTGGVTQFAIDATQILLGPESEVAAARARLGKFVPPVAAFAVGAIAGALSYSELGFFALALPIVGLAAVLFLAGRCPLRPKAP